jgi:heavy metal sensor kinase
LRVRLTLWHVAALVGVLGVYIVVVYAIVRQNLSDTLDQQLRRDFQWAAATVDYTTEGGFEWTEPELIVGDDAPWVQIWSADGSQLLVMSAEARRRPVPDSRRLAVQGDDRIVSVPTDAAPFRILTRRGAFDPARGAAFNVPVVMQVARSEAAMRQQLAELSALFAFGLPLAVAVAGLGGYWVARRALAPVERMTDRARMITAARLHDRLPVHNPEDEMGRLATVFNETLERLEASFDQMRHFTGDVSHELRTPLTAIRSVGEVGLREHRDEAAYRAIIASMLEEVDRLTNLVDRLLTLSRAETGQAKLALDVVDLRDLAEDVVGYLGVLAEEKRQSLALDCVGTPHGIADRLVLRQSLVNLVDNAIKYTPAGGRICIRVSEDAAGASIEVTDTGPGVAPELQARIFDRYYRGSGTPEAEIGGSGLGLAIAKWVVEAHGGQLSLEQTSRGGSTFRIRLPRATPTVVQESRSLTATGV